MAAAAGALPSPFRNMPSRAAECHIRGEATVSRLLNPHENKRCVVKLLGDLFPSYELRKPAGSQARGSVRQEAPQGIYEVFPICDPKTTFASRRACSDAVHRMLRATPVVGDFDLARANWDKFLPDDVAGLVLRSLGGDQAGCYDIVISLKIWVTVVDDMAVVGDMAECSICLSDLLKDQDSVRLPGCSHDFHRSCLTPWLHKAKTCPMCRAVMPSHVLYSLMHPQRRQ